MICYGLNGDKYTIFEKKNNEDSGGEGKIYYVSEDDKLRAKIFYDRILDKYRKQLYKHILWLSEQGFTEFISGFRIAWPKDLLFVEITQNKLRMPDFFCGYVMQNIEHISDLDTALTDGGIICKNATFKIKYR